MAKTKRSVSQKADPIAKQRFYNEFRSIKTGQMTPITESYLRDIALEVIRWAEENDNALKLVPFYRSKGISSHTLRKWLDQYPFLKEAHEEAILIIGDRREIGAIKKMYAENSIHFMMPKYDPDWKEMTQWRAELKSKADAVATANAILTAREIDVEMPAFNKPTPEEVAGKVRRASGGSK